MVNRDINNLSGQKDTWVGGHSFKTLSIIIIMGPIFCAPRSSQPSAADRN